MPGPSPSPARGSVASLRELYSELYVRARAGQYGLLPEAFEQILSQIQSRYCADASSSETAQFLCSLQIEDLALAHGCASGHERAWEIFLTRFRVRLYEVAYAITRDESRGRELADGLYADLYGTSLRDGQRISKLASYSGRGSLEGWLRTVLSQEFVNRYRAQSRLVSLDEEEEGGSQFAAQQSEDITPADPRVNASVDAALAELDAEERFILASYYLDGRKLNEIGRMLGVHESSISRRLDKIAAKLRKRVLHHLEARGMSRRQAQEALEADVRDLTVDVRTRLQEQREENPAGP